MHIANRPTATGSSFASMFFLGVGVAIVGATARAVGLTPSQIGYLIAAQNVGFGIAVLVGGVLADRYRKPVILAVGLVMLGASFALLYRSPLFVVNLAIMLLMGLGMGSVEAVTDAWLLELHTRNESRLVTINHFFVSVGSVVITLYLMAMQLDWERSLAQVAVVLGVLAILVAFLRPSGTEEADVIAPGESRRSAP
ncbi:MAG: MFS transporter, partial [Spirochaetota bacterium]